MNGILTNMPGRLPGDDLTLYVHGPFRLKELRHGIFFHFSDRTQLLSD